MILLDLKIIMDGQIKSYKNLRYFLIKIFFEDTFNNISYYFYSYLLNEYFNNSKKKIIIIKFYKVV